MRSKIKIKKEYSEYVSLIVCDNCRTAIVGENEHSLPEGTVFIRKVQSSDKWGEISDNDKEFCSEECLKKYYAN